jgi:hypothetical protein
MGEGVSERDEGEIEQLVSLAAGIFSRARRETAHMDEDDVSGAAALTVIAHAHARMIASLFAPGTSARTKAEALFLSQSILRENVALYDQMYRAARAKASN